MSINCNLPACIALQLTVGLCRQYAGLKEGQVTAKPKPVFGRLEGDFVTTVPDVLHEVLAEAKA